MSRNERLYRRRAEIHETPMDDENFLADPRTDGIFHLNPPGRAIWKLLETPHSRDQLQSALSKAFPDVDPARIAADVDSFLDLLDRVGLIEAEESRDRQES